MEAILKILDPDNAPDIPYDQFDQIQKVFENLPRAVHEIPVAYHKYIAFSRCGASRTNAKAG